MARLRREWKPTLALPDPLNPDPLTKAKEAVPIELPHPSTWKPLPSQQTERKRLARRVERQERYEQVVSLHKAGLTQVKIAKRLDLSARTIRKWLGPATFPEMRPRPKRRSIFDCYSAYVLKRWPAGQQDGHQLWEEIAAQGFKGTERTVQRYLQQLRDNQGQPLLLAEASPLEGLRARKAVWWFIREPSKLKVEEMTNLKLRQAASASLAEVYQLVQSFMEMMRELKGEQLEEWLSQVKASGYAELHSFARGVEKDRAAVLAGLSLPYSNGIAEGHNHRLKLIKRSMYGRAKLELLKERVLATA